MKFLIRPIRKQFSADKELIENIHNIIGEDPDNLALYKLSFRRTRIPNPDHTTFQENNERLEFLGDTVLDLIIAEYLFRRYPTKDEGFLTASKSNLVNRELLGSLCKKMGLDSMIVHESLFDSGTQPKNIYGDTLEAFIAAIYLDKGYDFTRDFVLDRMFGQFTDIESLINLSKNFKSKLLEWSQKNVRTVEYVLVKESGAGHRKMFTVQVLVDKEPLGEGFFSNKKQAEQNAAKQACEKLGISE